MNGLFSTRQEYHHTKSRVNIGLHDKMSHIVIMEGNVVPEMPGTPALSPP